MRRDCRAEQPLVARPTSGDLFICAKDLFVEATSGQQAMPLYWLVWAGSSGTVDRVLRASRPDQAVEVALSQAQDCVPTRNGPPEAGAITSGTPCPVAWAIRGTGQAALA